MTQQGINNASMLKVGTILRGTYRIDSYLSSGGFGNTYVATNIEFEERVAIKEFFMKGVTQRDDNQTTVSVSNLENTNSFQEQKEKFKKEARRLRKMQNEHLVRVHDLFDENGTTYYVMDYVDGESLSGRLKRTGKPMSEQEVCAILPQILDALKAVHNEGFCHLDIKPSNIMLDKGGKIKLIDFGASKQLGANGTLTANAPTAFAQTPGYAPREQMEQNLDKIGPWTDIYALGATLYNLLTNKRPPLPSDIDDDESEDKHEAFSFADDISNELKQLILRMTTTNRLHRLQNVDEIVHLLGDRVTSENTIPIKGESMSKSEDESVEETILEEKPLTNSSEESPKNNIKAEQKIERNIESNSNAGKETNKWKWLIVPALLIVGCLIFVFSKQKGSLPVMSDDFVTDTIAIYGPKYTVGSKDGWLSIKTILLTSDETRIDFEYVNRYEQGGWCSIDKNSYLSDGVNQYKMKNAINIDIAPKQTMFSQQYQVLNFTLTFPPLKRDIKSIDFIEGTDGSTWNLKNICIDTNYYSHRDSIIRTMLNTCFDQDAISGTFTMGNSGWEGTDPQSKVTLSDYLISRYEVTQEQWECVMGNNPSYIKGKNKPVTNVSWEDCQSYIQELVRITGIPFQLPTEAQWEFAARGGKKAKGYSFAGGNNLNDVAWYSDNSNSTIHDVGQKKPNELGLYDMSGNVWEWCWDYYANYSAKNKKDPHGPEKGSDRINRGGSYNEKAKANNYGYSDFWVFARNADKPTASYTNVGLRLVINIPNQ